MGIFARLTVEIFFELQFYKGKGVKIFVGKEWRRFLLLSRSGLLVDIG